MSEYRASRWSLAIEPVSLLVKDTLCWTLACSFKKATGMTFTEYLNRFRIQKAVEILNDENTSSPEVGYLCGFSTPKYFRDVFRKYVGCTPKEYREAARNHSKWPETQ